MNNVRLRAETVVSFDAFAPHDQFALAGSMPLFAFGYLHYVPVVSDQPFSVSVFQFFSFLVLPPKSFTSRIQATEPVAPRSFCPTAFVPCCL